MPITEGTQPSPVQVTGGATTGTTASFTPEPGALLILLVAADGANVTSATTVVVTDSLGGTWTLRKRQNTFVQGPPDIGGTAEVWIRDSPGTSLTVTGTWTSTNGGPDGVIVVRTLLGALPTAQQNGATGGSGGTSVPPSVTLTPTQIGSRIYGSGLRWVDNATLTPNSDTVDINQFNDASTGDTWTTFKSNADTTSLTSTAYGYTNANNEYNFAAVEILTAAGSDALPATLAPPVVNLPWLRLPWQLQPAGQSDLGQTTQITDEQGPSPLGLTASGTAVHIGQLSGPTALGLAGSGTAQKVIAQTGSTFLGLAATATEKKVAPQAGPVALGLVGTAIDKKVAVETGPAVLGLAGTGTDQKVAVEKGTNALGLATSSIDAKIAVEAGVSALGLTGKYSNLVTKAQGGVAFLGFAATGADKKVAPQAGPTGLGFAANGSAVKVAPQSGRDTIGLTAAGADTKVAVEKGASAFGLAAASRAAHGQTGITTFGLATRSTALKKTPEAGSAFLGSTTLAADKKVAAERGSSNLGLTSRHDKFPGSIAAAGTCFLLLGSFQHQCITYRSHPTVTSPPSTGRTIRVAATTSRPATGTTSRPNTGVTEEPC